MLFFKNKDKTNNKNKIFKAILNGNTIIIINLDKLTCMQLDKNVLIMHFSDQLIKSFSFEGEPEAQRFLEDVETVLVS